MLVHTLLSADSPRSKASACEALVKVGPSRLNRVLDGPGEPRGTAMRIAERLAPVIASVLSRNAKVSSSLRGGAFCANIERPPDGEPWVQIKTGALNVFYPAEDPPLARLAGLPALPADASCPAWEPWKYATLEFQPFEAGHVAHLVEALFVAFYDFPADTELEIEIFDMR